MATANQIDMPSSSARSARELVVVLAAMPPAELATVLGNLAASFPAGGLTVATPDALATEAWPGLEIVPVAATNASWTLTAADFVNAHQLAGQYGARAVLMLGPGSGSLRPAALSELAHAVLATVAGFATVADLAVPRYELPPHAGLINSAVLYPLTRALFSSRVRFPLAFDLGLSLRMLEKLATAGQRFTALNQGDALVWPIDEAAVAGYAIREIDVGPRTTPQPAGSDINAILASVTGSLFADIDAKAAYWQRTRSLAPVRDAVASPDHAPGRAPDQAPDRAPDQAPGGPADIAPMLDAFRLAYTNLQEIWSLVLPPNSLLGLKRLSVTDAASFRMPEALWARIVYDFLLAYRLRTINRGHLLGALIPLYLAWVASYLRVTDGGVDPEKYVEVVASAFEADKAYLVARWRWPDRFNP